VKIARGPLLRFATGSCHHVGVSRGRSTFEFAFVFFAISDGRFFFLARMQYIDANWYSLRDFIRR
jgi:hypothetical protein